MKNLYNLLELLIILCLAVLVVTPEICYSLVLRGRDKVEMMIEELWIIYKRTIKNM